MKICREPAVFIPILNMTNLLKHLLGGLLKESK